ncbi:hypothetical protein F4604DRAFT_1516111, partial [Suillus subluteus]
SLAKLDDTNYTSWSTRMKAVLIKKGYWSLLILTVEDSQLPHMDGDNPKVIWDELVKVHHAQGLSTQLTAIRKFVRLEKKADQSMSSWIGNVCALAHHLKCVEITLPDIFTIIVLTSGLPPEYEPVVVVLNAVDSAKLTLNVAIARLLNEE